MALEGQIIVSTDQIRTQASLVKSEIDRMRTRFDRLKGLIDASSSYWIGDGGDAHREQYTGKLDWVEEMLKRYEEHVKDLEQMAGIYESTERAVTMFSELLPVSELD